MMFGNSDRRRTAPEFISAGGFLNNDDPEHHGNRLRGHGISLMNQPCWTGRGVYGSGWIFRLKAERCGL